MPTPKIFEFDENDLAMYEEGRIDKVLAQSPDIYINHLGMARFISLWADRLERHEIAPDTASTRGYVDALRTVAAHLRQGDFVPGGHMTSEE